MSSTSLVPRRFVAAVALAISLPAQGVGQSDAPEAALQQALEVLRSGRIGEARGQLEQMVIRWPRHRRANYQLGRLAFERGDVGVAGGYLEIAIDGEFPRVFSAWYYLGRIRTLERDFSGAVEAFDQASERAPGFAPARIERARALFFQNEVEAGLQELSSVSKMPGSPPQASVLQGQLLMVLGRTEEARRSLEIEIPESSEGRRSRSQELQWLRRVLELDSNAYRELAKDLGAYPERAMLYWALGASQLETDPGRARKLFQISLDVDSENPATWMSIAYSGAGEVSLLPAAMPRLQPSLIRAQQLLEKGRSDEAVTLVRSLLQQRALLVPGWILLAEGAEGTGDLWLALEIYQQLLEWLGEIPSIELSLGRVAQTMGFSDLAACAVERAHRHEGGDGASWYLLAAIEESRNEIDSAIAACQQAISLGFEEARAWLKLGDLYFRQMRVTESIAAFEKAIRVDPLAAEEVRPFALSTLTTEQYAALRGLLERLLEARPESVSTIYSLGVMSLRENSLEDARRYFERLAELAPGHRQVHYNLGQIYLRQGETEAGQAEMERFQQSRKAEDEEWERHNQAHRRRLRAREAVEEGSMEEAITLLHQSIADGTAESSDLLELGAAYLLADRPTESLATYDRILSFSPYDRAALEGVLAAAEGLGEVARIEEMERQLKLLDWPCMMMNTDKGEGEP